MFSLSFAPEFFCGEDALYSDFEGNKPHCLVEAIQLFMKNEEAWEEFAQEEFQCSGDDLEIISVIERAKEIDSCDRLESPVGVYLDRDRMVMVQVHDLEVFEQYDFDDMYPHELRKFWGRWSGEVSREDAERFFVNYALEDPTGALETLAALAINKSCAIGLRLKGEIGRALSYEEAVELHYAELPESLRW